MRKFNGDIVDFIKQYTDTAGRPRVLVGFANVSDIPVFANYDIPLPYAISIACALDPKAISEIQDGPTREYYDEHVEIGEFGERLELALVDFINDKGYDAIPLSGKTSDSRGARIEHAQIVDGGARKREAKSSKAGASNTPDVDIPQGIKREENVSGLSHKVIAAHAGLGWIGKNGLVVTKHYGTAIRLITILTDAPLDCSREVFLSRCSRCMECIKTCPSGAINAVEWEPVLRRHDLVDPVICEQTCHKLSMENFGVKADLCGVCIYSCPYTKSYIKRNGLACN